jgi:predicted DNA-binding transcriptional regulator AlpA
VPGLGAFHRRRGRFFRYVTIIVIVTPSHIPDLVGLAEVAELIGKSRRQAIRWTARPDFPKPIVRLRATPVWLRADVERWQQAAALRRPRRP